VAEVEFLLHSPAFTTTTFVTSPALLRLVQSSARRLGGMLVRTFGDQLFARTATLSTQVGLDLVSLPEDFSTLTSLHWIDGNCAHLLERTHTTDYKELAQAWSDSDFFWFSNQKSKYVLEANTIRFVPPPSAVYAIRCAYQTGLKVETITDILQGGAGWSDWLVADICEAVRIREQKDASDFMMRKAKIEQDLLSQARNRDGNGVKQVRDVRGDDTFGWPFYRRGF